jgi:hypothetical protein
MKKASLAVLLCALVVSGLSLTTSAQAKPSPNAMSVHIDGNSNAVITGTVASVSGSTIQLTSWLGTWSITTSANTKFSGGIFGASDIKAQDVITIHGTLATGMNINATRVKINNMKTRMVTGTISNLNTGQGTFILTTPNATALTVTTNASTKIYLNGNASTLANLSNGLTAGVSGSLNATANTLTAETIKVPAPQILQNSHGKFKGILNLFSKWHLNAHASN